MSMWMTSGGGTGGSSPAGQEWSVNIIPTGDIDGVNMTFVVPDPYYSGTMMVYLRGLRQIPGTDFTETANGFIMAEPPETDDVLICDYRKI